MGKPIHQLVHTLSYGDAISTEVLALQRVFRGLGYDSEIFRIHEHPKLRGASRPYSELARSADADVLLHYSLGSPLNAAYSQWRRGQKRLVYHNITPAEWYRKINQRVADDIEQGQAELPELCAESDALWADSPFNAREIEALGYSAEVLDLPVDPARWGIARNEGLFNSVRQSNGTQVLHVGRLAPNKCVEDIIKAFYFLVKYVDRDARLRLVGIDTDTELYSFSLRELANYLGIGYAVEFVGALSDEEVRSMYEASDVYICMSEHEGFCLPIIEAMYFGLPVIAYAAGAVPETMGDAGIVVREKRHAEIGALIHEVVTNTGLRDELVERGKQRVENYTFERFASRVESLLSTSLRAGKRVEGI